MGWLAVGLLVLLLPGCRQDMHDQAKYEAYEASPFFANATSARPLPAGTVPRGFLREDVHFYTGMTPDLQTATTFPFPVTEKVLLRGRERYDIFCAPCHDRVGTGNGMIVRRGFRRPSSFHVHRLREAAVGYFFDVITHGFGTMPSYASQIPPEDRWAIVAYIRALQFSQHAPVAELPPADREGLASLGKSSETRGEGAP